MQTYSVCYRESRETGIVAFDSESQQQAMFFMNPFLVSGNNPMICECSSHIGLNGNYFCPRCMVGGDKAYKQTDEGYHSLFYVRNIFSCSTVGTI